MQYLYISILEFDKISANLNNLFFSELIRFKVGCFKMVLASKIISLLNNFLKYSSSIISLLSLLKKICLFKIFNHSFPGHISKD